MPYEKAGFNKSRVMPLRSCRQIKLFSIYINEIGFIAPERVIRQESLAVLLGAGPVGYAC